MSERKFDIESKLIGLLRLAQSNTENNQNESAAAMEMAIRLATKHGVKLSSLTTEQSPTKEWFRGSTNSSNSTDTQKEYVPFEYIEISKWCSLAEKFRWERHSRFRDPKEGEIYCYRNTNGTTKLELRIFNRPWGDVEFEVIRNPDPIIGDYQSWMEGIFDVVYLGVTFSDFREWIKSNNTTDDLSRQKEPKSNIPYLNIDV